MLEDKSYPELQQLCYQAIDVTFENREVIAIANDYLAGHYDWMFFIVRSGSIELSDTELSENILGGASGSGMNTPNGGTNHHHHHRINSHGTNSHGAINGGGPHKQTGQLAARYSHFNSRVQSRAPSRMQTRANSITLGPGPAGLGLIDKKANLDSQQQHQQHEQQHQQQQQLQQQQQQQIEEQKHQHEQHQEQQLKQQNEER